MQPIRLSMAASLVSACVIAILAAQSAPAQNFKLLYSFTGGADGAYPAAGLTRDAKGNLYGTTFNGGTGKCGNHGFGNGCGVVFKLDKTGRETVLHSFTGGKDGDGPYAGLIRDASGTLYGVTVTGGSGVFGTVYNLDTSGHESILYNFTGGTDGAFPNGTLVRDSAGNLYGTTINGGAASYGIVFKVDTTGTETVLHNFGGGTDGIDPYAGLTRDAAGNFYGTTYFGGTGTRCPDTCGTVFKLDTNGKETVLHSFTGGKDGANPYAGVIRDAAGNLYGTTSVGGKYSSGIVFKLDRNRKLTVLYTFTGQGDGAVPYAGLVRDTKGNLYGTTNAGGTEKCNRGNGCGVVFKLDKTGRETVLHSFTGGKDGDGPYYGSLLMDASGNLYGTTFYGGTSGKGVVFRLTP